MASSNNSVNFKVFLRDENSTEARRFVVDDASVVTNFVFMKEKLQMVFPKLRETAFRITWKDTDGDEITIDSDEDLITAFTEMNGLVKVLYLTVLERKPGQTNFPTADAQFSDFRPQVVCDVCETLITGNRYKCLQCHDYDLCLNCEYDGHHSEHLMLRTSRVNFPYSRCARKTMDQLNKSIKKINHVAYKEACRASKFKGRHWERRRCHADQEKAQTSQQSSDSAENSNQQRPQQQQPSGCPMQDFNLEHITPLIYPFLDALSNAVPGATPNANEASNNNNTNNASSNQAPHFMDLIRNAINNFFEGANHGHHQQQNQQTPESSNVPSGAAAATATAGASSTQTSSGQETPTRVVPMEVEKEAGAPKVPSQDSAYATRREPGWTIINGNESHTFEAPKPNAPAERDNSKIADGLKQLLDMGFSDELNLVALLRRFDGNVGEVVKYLFENNI